LSSSNWIFTACVAYKNPVRTEMEFSYSQTENFEMEKLSSDTGYFKKPVEINRGYAPLNFLFFSMSSCGKWAWSLLDIATPLNFPAPKS
jgi:hypothetical protein